MAKIRHIVFNTTDPERLAKFYVDMGLTIQQRAANGSISLADGYINLSIHTNKIDGKPNDRHFAEYRAIDPDGNNFDIAVNGYDDVRPERVGAPVRSKR